MGGGEVAERGAGDADLRQQEDQGEQMWTPASNFSSGFRQDKITPRTNIPSMSTYEGIPSKRPYHSSKKSSLSNLVMIYTAS